jgi:hypothetical protein
MEILASESSLRNHLGKPECILSFNMGWWILVFYPELASMNYFDSDMSKGTNTVVYFDWKTVILYLRLRTMSHTIYAAQFEQTIIHQHVHLRRESQSHAPAHVLMILYPIDKSLVCLQSERRTLC